MAELSEETKKMLLAAIQPAESEIIRLDSSRPVTVTKPSGTSSTLDALSGGFYMAVSSQPVQYTSADVRLSSMYARMQQQYDWPVGYYCAQCGERISYDKDGYRKARGKPAWVHIRSSSPWCPKTKQHGPKTRRVLPVPSLLVINESGLLDV